MPWKTTTQVQARVRFVEDWLAKEYESLAVLCRFHGVAPNPTLDERVSISFNYAWV
jgi:hypothetical protein